MHGGNSDAAEMLRSMRAFLKENDMMAYLSMMAVRLLELGEFSSQRAASICIVIDGKPLPQDPDDATFGPKNFRNEITWKRRVGMSSAVHESNRFGPAPILFCSTQSPMTLCSLAVQQRQSGVPGVHPDALHYG